MDSKPVGRIHNGGLLLMWPGQGYLYSLSTSCMAFANSRAHDQSQY